MTVEGAPARRRRRSTGFGPERSQARALPLTWRIGLTLVPAALCLAHLTFGANQPAAALWLSAGLALSLCIVLVTPLRRGLFDLSPTMPLIALFGVVVGVAAWSLTSWAPGGAHPLWSWAGHATGSLTIDRSATTVEIVKLVGLAAVFVVGALQGMRRDRGAATVEGIVWAGGAWSAISLLMFLAGTQVAEGGRLTGGFLSANNGATVFGILTVLGLSLFLRGWRRAAGRGMSDRSSAVAVPLACLALSAVCLLLTASRMGVASTLAAVGVLLLWELGDTQKGKAAIAVAGGVLMALAGILLLGGNSLLWTRAGALDRDVDVRSEIFAAHWDAFLASPLFGYGLGSFDAINTQIMTSETAGSLWSIRATHNVYLQWLEEGGLVGALPMFALLGLILCVALLRGGPGKGRNLPHGLLCTNLVVLLHGLTDYALQVPSIAAFWAFLLGVQFAFGQGRGG